MTKEQIESSDLYEQIADRIDLLPFLEELFDSNDTVFKYNEKKNSFSMIKADYLMKNSLVDKNVFIAALHADIFVAFFGFMSLLQN